MTLFGFPASFSTVGRPKKLRPKKPVKLTIDPLLRERVDAYVKERNSSISELVSTLLENEIRAESRKTPNE